MWLRHQIHGCGAGSLSHHAQNTTNKASVETVHKTEEMKSVGKKKKKLRQKTQKPQPNKKKEKKANKKQTKKEKKEKTKHQNPHKQNKHRRDWGMGTAPWGILRVDKHL